MQAEFIVFHGQATAIPCPVELFSFAKEVFSLANVEIERYGNAKGKIVKYVEKNFLKYINGASLDSIELYGGENGFGYEGQPANNWAISFNYFADCNTLIIGNALLQEGGVVIG